MWESFLKCLPSLTCPECGSLYVLTPSRFWACPRIHGRLIAEELLVERAAAASGVPAGIVGGLVLNLLERCSS